MRAVYGVCAAVFVLSSEQFIVWARVCVNPLSHENERREQKWMEVAEARKKENAWPRGRREEEEEEQREPHSPFSPPSPACEGLGLPSHA